MSNISITEDQLANLSKNSNTTVISGDSLPTFRGRKRPNEPPFEEKNTSNHVVLLKSYIVILNDCSEADKKQLLVRSADKKLDDFHLTVSGLVNGDLYKDSTFEEIVLVLENVYVQKEKRNISSICRAIRDSSLVEDETLTSQMVQSFTKFSEVSGY